MNRKTNWQDYCIKTPEVQITKLQPMHTSNQSISLIADLWPEGRIANEQVK